MASLAKLSDIKSRLDFSGTNKDQILIELLDKAAAIAERIAGRPLRRKLTTEYPSRSPDSASRMRLKIAPIESVTSVKQRYYRSADWADATAKIEDDDFVIDGNDLVAENWYLAPKMVQVIYTGGYADPQRISIALATATWTASSKTLTQVGAFASYTFTPGDVIILISGTGVMTGQYRIGSKVSDDALILQTSISFDDLATGDIVSVSSTGGLNDAPDDLQDGIINQVIRMYQTRDTAGLREIDLGGGGGVSLAESKPHLALERAAMALKRFSL